MEAPPTLINKVTIPKKVKSTIEKQPPPVVDIYDQLKKVYSI